MKPILDATAGNRHLWKKGDRGKNPFIVYVDYEIKLFIPPTIFADFTHLPFRENIFSVTIWDPPFQIGTHSFRWWNPDQTKKSLVEGKWLKTWGHYGCYSSRREMVLNLLHGSMEISRVSKRLCMKWGTGPINIGQLKSLLRQWKQIFFYSRKGRGYYINKNSTFWITFIKNGNPGIKQSKLIQNPAP